MDPQLLPPTAAVAASDLLLLAATAILCTAGADLIESESSKRQLEQLVQQLQQQLEEYKAAALQRGTATEGEEQHLEDQLAAKQEDLEKEREVVKDLQEQAQSARKAPSSGTGGTQECSEHYWVPAVHGIASMALLQRS
jgi:multidrug efflux pump subunit AcrA (membrane-fusion protein)